MSGGQVFALVWSLVAMGLGTFFAVFPERVADRYEKQTSRGWGIRPQPRSFTIPLYRIGGVAFVLIGLGIGISAIAGWIR